MIIDKVDYDVINQFSDKDTNLIERYHKIWLDTKEIQKDIEFNSTILKLMDPMNKKSKQNSTIKDFIDVADSYFKKLKEIEPWMYVGLPIKLGQLVDTSINVYNNDTCNIRAITLEYSVSKVTSERINLIALYNLTQEQQEALEIGLDKNWVNSEIEVFNKVIVIEDKVFVTDKMNNKIDVYKIPTKLYNKTTLHINSDLTVSLKSSKMFGKMVDLDILFSIDTNTFKLVTMLSLDNFKSNITPGVLSTETEEDVKEVYNNLINTLRIFIDLINKDAYAEGNKAKRIIQIEPMTKEIYELYKELTSITSDDTNKDEIFNTRDTQKLGNNYNKFNMNELLKYELVQDVKTAKPLSFVKTIEEIAKEIYEPHLDKIEDKMKIFDNVYFDNYSAKEKINPYYNTIIDLEETKVYTEQIVDTINNKTENVIIEITPYLLLTDEKSISEHPYGVLITIGNVDTAIVQSSRNKQVYVKTYLTVKEESKLVQSEIYVDLELRDLEIGLVQGYQRTENGKTVLYVRPYIKDVTDMPSFHSLQLNIENEDELDIIEKEVRDFKNIYSASKYNSRLPYVNMYLINKERITGTNEMRYYTGCVSNKIKENLVEITDSDRYLLHPITYYNSMFLTYFTRYNLTSMYDKMEELIELITKKGVERKRHKQQMGYIDCYNLILLNSEKKDIENNHLELIKSTKTPTDNFLGKKAEEFELNKALGITSKPTNKIEPSRIETQNKLDYNQLVELGIKQGEEALKTNNNVDNVTKPKISLPKVPILSIVDNKIEYIDVTFTKYLDKTKIPGITNKYTTSDKEFRQGTIADMLSKANKSNLLEVGLDLEKLGTNIATNHNMYFVDAIDIANEDYTNWGTALLYMYNMPNFECCIAIYEKEVYLIMTNGDLVIIRNFDTNTSTPDNLWVYIGSPENLALDVEFKGKTIIVTPKELENDTEVEVKSKLYNLKTDNNYADTLKQLITKYNIDVDSINVCIYAGQLFNQVHNTN